MRRDTAPDRVAPERGRADLFRSVAVLVAAAVQTAAGVVGGAGLWGEPVGTVANSYPTLLLPAGGAFAIWTLIYATFAALAVRQALPAQRARRTHRSTGWWLASAGVLNAGWVALFAHREIVAAQVVIVALLVCLTVAATRLTHHPAAGWPDRLLVHTPVAVYTGWVAMATVAGAATTGAASDAAPSVTVAVIAVLLTGAVAATAALRLPAVVGYAAAVCWALIWIVVGTPAAPVQVAGTFAVVMVLVASVVRAYRAGDVTRSAWG
ncbi:TspO/MBR related protein [Saccharothrix carnea]|uniref:TspO/MBR related protein n=1 Tax=Saccharothrix carnea TaxID=1280637 RepID=A0A2P8HLL4_SACCR|nr:tryptophan-rich sensory protein [Saccharothrix carnea]PSL47112.1 TspO/MBR related protein [Saccharothrix carnea]